MEEVKQTDKIEDGKAPSKNQIARDQKKLKKKVAQALAVQISH